MSWSFGTECLVDSCFILCHETGDAVVNVYINHEKKFAFVEMRSVEEASNAMALDGIIFEVHFLSSAGQCKVCPLEGVAIRLIYSLSFLCYFIVS